METYIDKNQVSETCGEFVRHAGISDGIVEALAAFVTTAPREIIVPPRAFGPGETEERIELARTLQALLEAEVGAGLHLPFTAVFWALIMCVPLQELRSAASACAQPGLAGASVRNNFRTVRARVGTLLKTCEL
jgi:hypothetical protein